MILKSSGTAPLTPPFQHNNFMNHLLNSAGLFLKKHLKKILIAWVAWMMPIHPLLLSAILFSFVDFVTGMLASWRTAVKSGIKGFGWVESKRMQKKFFDLFFYLLAIVLAFHFEALFTEFIPFPLTKLVAFIILSVEFWSNMENLSRLTGLPLDKRAFLNLVNRIRSKTELKEEDKNKADNPGGHAD